MLYETECWAVKNQHENNKASGAEMKIWCWMCGILDKIRLNLVETLLRWFRHVERRHVDSVVSSGAAIAGNMPGGHVSNRSVPRPMNVGMQRMHQLQAYNLTSQAGMGSGINPAGIPMQRGVPQQAHQQQQLRRKDQMGMPGYPPQQKSRRITLGLLLFPARGAWYSAQGAAFSANWSVSSLSPARGAGHCRVKKTAFLSDP
ncbi:cyclin-dependent kinase [Trifolium pratense]|uniref:Cyclin-dependent kinase n=1 Tax=Trifolium pratense TaxID=57577 RepID=A0A2K3NTN7_TRIPR|nr:cyclin-dependent kinase [Trifolium pratense]